MTATGQLDKPLEKCGTTKDVIWKTVTKDGVKYTLQVRIDTKIIEQEIAAHLEAGTWDFGRNLHSGHLIVSLTRAL